VPAPHKYPQVLLVLKDSNGADVLNMEMSEPEALWELTDFFRCQLSEGFNGSIYFERPEKDQAETELREERDRLLAVLDACGGRNVEVAEEIEEINRQLGESEESDEECGICEHKTDECGPLAPYAGHDAICEDCVEDIKKGRLK